MYHLLKAFIHSSPEAIFLDVIGTKNCYSQSYPQSTHTGWQPPLFWRTFLMMEKLAQAGRGEGGHAHHLLLLLPSRKKLQCTLQLSGQIHSPCFVSTNICTLWIYPPPHPLSKCGLIRLKLVCNVNIVYSSLRTFKIMPRSSNKWHVHEFGFCMAAKNFISQISFKIYKEQQ
jgi:hypothetical protein